MTHRTGGGRHRRSNTGLILLAMVLGGAVIAFCIWILFING